MNLFRCLKNGEYTRLKFLSLGDLNKLCKMLASLSNNTRRFFHDPKFEAHNLRSYIKTYSLLLTRLFFNKWLYKIFGLYFSGIVALNSQKEVIGLVYLSVKSHGSFKSAEYGIVVRDDYQGKSLGTILTTHTIHIAKKFGVNVIRLSVSSENTKAIKLYKKFGFVIEGHHKRADVWRGKIFDVYYMALHLR